MPYNTAGFAEYLKRIMKSRGLSTGELTELLGLKSKTTVVRVLQNNAGEKAVMSFRNLLVSSRELALTAEEVQMLDDSVSSQKKESSYNFIFSELWALLYRRSTPRMEVRLIGTEPYATLTEFGEMLVKTPVECRIVNCGFHSLVGSMPDFLCSQENPISVSQYFFNTDGYPRRLVQMIGRIVPVLAFDNYMAYTVSQDSADGCFDLNVIAVRCGSGEEYEVLFCSEKTAILTKGEGLYRKWEMFLDSFRKTPVKSVKDPGTYNLIGFMDRYRRLEEKHDVYKFRPDLCFNCIHVDIMKDALVDGCEAKGVPLSKETLASLFSIQRKRYGNTHSSRQTTRLIVSETAMRKFAETGYMSDHMYAMRAFTPEERIRILNDCIRQMESGHAAGLRIHLLNREDEERIYANEYPIEMVCYDGSCVQLTPAMTDYNFRKGHSEIFIGQETFRSLFVEFFMNDLIQYHTLPEEAAVQLFRELVRELENGIG
ncbi:MAG: hypothetical protein IJV76_04230 [Clostridia bacterium]|nr:hypothetical protein [Clostridia bacterium]